LSELGGDYGYHVLTAATPIGESVCTVRLSLIMRPPVDGSALDDEASHYLLRQCRVGVGAGLTDLGKHASV